MYLVDWIKPREGGAVLMDEKLRGRLCENDLIFTTSLIIELPVAFPIRPQLAHKCEYLITFLSNFTLGISTHILCVATFSSFILDDSGREG